MLKLTHDLHHWLRIGTSVFIRAESYNGKIRYTIDAPKSVRVVRVTGDDKNRTQASSR